MSTADLQHERTAGAGHLPHTLLVAGFCPVNSPLPPTVGVAGFVMELVGQRVQIEFTQSQ
jgi:hypothetical protein